MVGEVQGEIRGGFRQGNVRSPLQDVLFCVDQVVEVAVRALSPSQHDPFTAMTCLDRLGASLRRLAGRQLTPLHRRDGEGRLRVLVPSVTFPAVVDEAFGPIRRRARGNAEVMVRLLQTLAVVAEATSRPEDRAAVWRHAEAVAHDAQRDLRDEDDRRVVEEILRTASRALRDEGGAATG
jgi:uncharacterized membrane protein